MGIAGRVYASRGLIGWVVLAADIAGDDLQVGMVAGRMDKFEYLICGVVLAASVPPAFNNASVVSENSVAWFGVATCK